MRRTLGELFGMKPKAITIGNPYQIESTMKVKFDPITNNFIGLPNEFLEKLMSSSTK